jgi:acyl carrier protein
MIDKLELELRGILAELGLIEAGTNEAEDISFADLKLDSLTLMDMCVHLEAQYDFIIEPADVIKQASVRNLAHYVASRRAART